MASFNKIQIVGHLGRDAALRYTPNGTAVADFTVATNERRKDKAGEYQELTTWFRISVFNKLAESVNRYLSKGSMVYVDGKLVQREYQDKDGNTRYSLEVTANDVQFLDARPDAVGQPDAAEKQPAKALAKAVAAVADDESSIPF